MKPMLSARTADPKNEDPDHVWKFLSTLKYPVAASPKLDGVRAIVKNGVVLSRTLKPIPNEFTQQRFGRPEFEGLDGELIVGPWDAPDVYNTTHRAVMAHAGEPDVKFYAFDLYTLSNAGFKQRHAELIRWHKEVQHYCDQCHSTLHVEIVPHNRIDNVEVLSVYEDKIVEAGFEGIMIRSLDGLYKHGRATKKEATLLKVKRFLDSDAEIIGRYEMMRNTNEAEVDELGYTKRATNAEGLVPAGLLGGWHVQDIVTGVEFDIGSGFTMKDRDVFWRMNGSEIGSIIKYKYMPHGVKDKPRHPRFLGFRDEVDL
jgi:DNA ligase-1